MKKISIIVPIFNEPNLPELIPRLLSPKEKITDKEIEINALETNKVFRSWLLPKGDYEMKSNFTFPNLILYKMISISTFIIWISVVIIFWTKKI